MNYINNNQKPYVDSGCNNIYIANKNYNNKIFMSEVQLPVNSNLGSIEVFVFTERGDYAIPGAIVNIYARQENNSELIYNTSTKNYPIIVRLPVSHPSGKQIRGPEYYFSTYDMTIQAPGFSPYRVNNIRLFDGITVKIDANLQPIVPGQYPIPETIVNIPPHPRDQVIN